jgi:hypothetical protein
MAIDLGRALQAAIQAATKEQSPPEPAKKKSHRLPVGLTVLVGAGMMTAGRVIAGGKGREWFESVQERIAALEEPSEQSEDFDEEDYEEEPEGEGEEDFDDEGDEEEEPEEKPRRAPRRSRQKARARS